MAHELNELSYMLQSDLQFLQFEESVLTLQAFTYCMLSLFLQEPLLYQSLYKDNT